MTWSSWLVMAAAVFASLATGVLVAYAGCLVMFRAFRIHARQVLAQRQILTQQKSLEKPRLASQA